MQEVYLIYDIGKTNKKVLLFDNDGKVVDQYSEQFAEIEDEDGFVCDDIEKIADWVLGQYELIKKKENYTIKAINFATYGASFVHVNEHGHVLTPLYNYLKPLPTNISQQFLNAHFEGSEENFSLNTASPFMGMLNSGLQLYWLKNTRTALWNRIAYSMHLPQYLHFLFTKKATNDFTSIGCHTGLYNVNNKQYHPWVFAEGIDNKLPKEHIAFNINEDGIPIGTGLHDSSSALIPYLQQYSAPFILISTGTWCINLNPFNKEPLTVDELHKDCLCYLQVDGKPVKASRIFLGKEHEMQCKRIANHFKTKEEFYKKIAINQTAEKTPFIPNFMEGSGPQPQQQKEDWNIAVYDNETDAYNALVFGLVSLLKESIDLILEENIKTFFIDGGFSANTLFKHYLQQHYPKQKIEVVEFVQATALGAYLHLKSNN